jgi:hypothetical protein
MQLCRYTYISSSYVGNVIPVSSPIKMRRLIEQKFFVPSDQGIAVCKDTTGLPGASGTMPA